MNPESIVIEVIVGMGSNNFLVNLPVLDGKNWEKG